MGSSQKRGSEGESEGVLLLQGEILSMRILLNEYLIRAQPCVRIIYLIPEPPHVHGCHPHHAPGEVRVSVPVLRYDPAAKVGG